MKLKIILLLSISGWCIGAGMAYLKLGSLGITLISAGILLACCALERPRAAIILAAVTFTVSAPWVCALTTSTLLGYAIIAFIINALTVDRILKTV